MKKVKVSVVIVSFNTKEILKNCLNLLAKASHKINLEVIVIDNNSKDGSPQAVKKEFPKVKLIKNPRNLFLHKAFNQGLERSRGNYILFLNSDTLPQARTIQKSLEFLRLNPNVAAVSCKHIEPGGNIDKTCSRFPTPLLEIIQSLVFLKLAQKTKFYKDYKYSTWSRNSIKNVNVIPGSYIFIRKEIIKKLNGFDENLKLFYGDVDLCVRIAKLKLHIYHLPQRIIHLRAQSINKLPKKQLRDIVRKDTFYYYKKHFGILAELVLKIVLSPNWLYWKLKKPYEDK